ncbi:MAG: hypothetical protein JSV16_06910 [Candidatus Hydrogenedentota bacterium]|nr:MAG: hypothetical protein JSV16_06910 [Candidatus Hydrogenedentota bacterium]
MAAHQKKLLSFPLPPPGTVFVNEHVSVRTEGTYRVVSVHGVVFAHYDVGDRAAEAYTMVNLFESGYANQNDIAEAFGYSSRSIRRYQERCEAGGLGGIIRLPGRPSSSELGQGKRDRTILQLKTKGFSNRAIAARFGLSEGLVRKSLRRLGWQPPPIPFLPIIEEAPASQEVSKVSPANGADEEQQKVSDGSREELLPQSLDIDPCNRSMDRLLAALGELEDAAPLFSHASRVPRAGVLLAIPSLVASGLLSVARRVYGTLGPAFYGLRTTLVAYVLLSLLRIPRPENLKEHAPADLGRIIGLDRMPEIKTLRRKLARLAKLNRSHELGREMARRRIAERGRLFGFLYVDGHVRAYHGKHKIAKTFLPRRRLAVPATTDYWVNDKKGDPLFVVTAEANAAMTRMLLPILEEVRKLVRPHRRITIVFDRGAWSPKLFQKLLVEKQFDILTYRKGRFRHISEKRFVLRKARLDGCAVEYLLHDQPVRLLRGKLRLRQVTRLTDTGHQTPVITSRWDLRDIVVAYRMFERWRQENFFKYMRQEFLIDSLADYRVESDDPARLVPNPARREVEKQLSAARVRFAKLKEQYGSTALDYLEGRTSTMREFTSAEKRINGEIKEAVDQIAALLCQRKAIPKRVPLAETSQRGREAVKLSTERKHLTNVLKLVAYQIESDLVERLRPHYARVDDEGRTLIQTAMQNAAAIEPTEKELRITLAPLSSPHRSKAVAALCQDLNQTNTVFPGTHLRLHFDVAEPPIS